MLPKLRLKKANYKVYKTGLPFYDTARLIGVAHLFFGTASSEIEDRGAYWEVRGIDLERDEKQIEWVIEEGKRKSHNFNQKIKQIKKAYVDLNQKLSNYSTIYFDGLSNGKYPALAEFDAALAYGPRGIDPLKDSVIVSSLGTKPKRKEKQYLIKDEDLFTASIGFCFSATIRSGEYRTHILPIFMERLVLSGYLNYITDFWHNSGEQVGNVLAAISILLDLSSKKIPIVDFTYTRVFGRNIILNSGYLGFEKLCRLWWEAVEENNERRLKLLNQIRSFLNNTRNEKARNEKESQIQYLARYLANFAVMLDVDSLCMIQKLKARILNSQQNVYPALSLFRSQEDIEEVRKMMEMEIELPPIPSEVTRALSKAMEFDEKGWMNQFTRLENAADFSQFINQIEHIISRSYYREQQKEGQSDIRSAMNRARELANSLRKLHSALSNEKIFRAWRAIFLLDVLSKMRFRTEGGD